MAYQIKLSPKGKWHRRQHGNGGDRTACDLPIVGAYLSREAVLDENLCDTCFTPRERDTGEMRRIERDALSAADVGYDDSIDADTDVDPDLPSIDEDSDRDD